MIEITDWFSSAGLDDRPWLLLGKGPTFERRHQYDLGDYHLLGLNHTVSVMKVDVAHIIDVDVVGDCADTLLANCRWLLMPRYPHLESTAGTRRLEEWFSEHPVLAELDDQGRLVWYNLSGSPVHGRSPVIGAKGFSSEAALNLLGTLGIREVRSLGVDGGRSYAASFEHLADRTLLANGAGSFDEQFDRLEVAAAEHGIDYRPLVEPLRIFVGTDESQVVAHRVLEYSIRRSSSIPVSVHPMLDAVGRIPRDPANKPRTTFSFCRFLIPRLCGFRGRALYLDADMLVFGDVAELADLAFDDQVLLCTAPPPTEAWDGHHSTYLGTRSTAVMLLDCGRLRWEVDEVIDGLDDGRYTYEELMSQVCVVDPEQIADRIPPRWNDLERYEPGETKLLHYTVVPTQPWKNDRNPLGELWMGYYRDAVRDGAVPPEEVEALVASGQGKKSLLAALRNAPSRRAVTTNASLDTESARRRIARLEAELAEVRSSWSWRIGEAVVGATRGPRRLIRRGFDRARRP